ncbi:MAG TPA: hypothetical protein VKQ32_16420, partial [Polyangia bacterium]|nr:hypothetical protein [Polyangia bacterium]
LAASSPLAGSPEGVQVRGEQDHPTALRLRLGGGPLPAGRFAVHFKLEAPSASRFTLAGATAEVAAGVPTSFDAVVNHAGELLTLPATAAGPL